jgi:8-oxo-dGTP pyrophosphatase MutT (NUDIX family)
MRNRKVSGAERVATVDPGCRLLVRGPFSPGDVSVRVRSEARPTTPELERRIEASWRATLAQAAVDGRHVFNGEVLRWLGAEVRSEGGRRRLELTVAPSTFREFVGTNLDPELKPDVAGGDLPWSQFANAMGTSSVLVTKDGAVVAGRRSSSVIGYAGALHSFGGMLEAVDLAGGAVDVFASLKRELREELGLADEEIEAPVLEGIILEPLIHQPEMIFHARIRLSFAELDPRWRSAESGDEHDELLALEESPADPEAEFARLAPVSPIGRAALALYWSRAKER